MQRLYLLFFIFILNFNNLIAFDIWLYGNQHSPEDCEKFAPSFKESTSSDSHMKYSAAYCDGRMLQFDVTCMEGYVNKVLNGGNENWKSGYSQSCVPCVPKPSPKEPYMALGAHASIGECNEAIEDLGKIYEKGNATCWTNSCGTPPFVYMLYATSKSNENSDNNNTTNCEDDEYLDINSTCKTKTSAYPNEIPITGDTGETSTGTLPITKESCEKKLITINSTGVYAPYAWDYSTNKCLALGFKCKQGRLYDKNSKTCKIPKDDVSFPQDEKNKCLGNDWGKRNDWNFCNECIGSVGIWRAPADLGYYGLECNKRYIEYQCKKDYRMKKFKEVSCGDPIPVDSETNELKVSSVEDTVFSDVKTKNKATVNPNDANSSVNEDLTKIERVLLDQIKPILDVSKNKLSSIDIKLSSANAKLDTINNNLTRTNSKLDTVNNTLNSLNNEQSFTNSKLDTVNNNLNSTNSKLDSLNNEQSSTNSKLDTSNDKLSSIDETLKEILESVGIEMDKDTTSLDNPTEIDSSIYDNLFENFRDMINGIVGIKDEFQKTKDMLNGDKPVLSIPRGGCNENMKRFSSYISPYSSIFALITYVVLMIKIFKMIFNYMARGE